MNNQSNVVKFLLQNGADPNFMSRRSGRTLLMAAAHRGCEGAIRELILSPRLKRDTNYCNSANRSSTWFLMKTTLNSQPKEERNKYQPSSVAKLFLEFHHDKLSLNEVDIEGMTPLLLTIIGGQGSIFQLRRLVQLQADLEYQSWSGFSAFHMAASQSFISLAMFELLEVTKLNDI
jgi:ankyrin repeat protein